MIMNMKQDKDANPVSRTMLRLESIEDGWYDGVGLRMTNPALESTKSLLDAFTSAGINDWTATPDLPPDGGVLVDFDDGRNASIEIRIRPEGSLIYEDYRDESGLTLAIQDIVERIEASRT